MAISPQSVFKSLSEDFRLELLQHNKIIASADAMSADFSGLAQSIRQKIELDLKFIAALGSQQANSVLHEQLSLAGWTRDDFAQTAHQGDRACALLCRHPDEFETALSIWNGNRMRGRIQREDGFRLPETGGYEFIPLSEKETEALRGVIQIAVQESYQNRIVNKVRLFQRSALGIPTESKEILQCEISFGEDPETIEVINEGVEGAVTISKLKRISIIIDTESRSLFVATEMRKKKLHRALAQILVQRLFEFGVVPPNLPAIRVHPERCVRPVEFAYSKSDGIKSLRVCELRFRLFGASNDLVFSARDDDSDTNVYDRPDIRKIAKRMRVWRAYIEFVFVPPSKSSELRRTITLTEPSSISFGTAFPEERLTIERVLMKSGLIDTDHHWDKPLKIRDIARLITPQHTAEVRSNWLPFAVETLLKSQIIKPGIPHKRAWCGMCGESHKVLAQNTADGVEHWVSCPVDLRIVKPEDLDTFVISTDGLLSWLIRSAVEASKQPDQIQRGVNVWLLGRMKKTSGQSVELILALDVDDPNTIKALNQFLVERHSEHGGAILTLASNPVQRVFPRDWRVVPLPEVCEIKGANLKFLTSRVETIRLGKSPKKKHKTEEEWAEIFELFLSRYPGEDRLHIYQVANTLVSEEPDICNVNARTIVPKLQAKFPDRFYTTQVDASGRKKSSKNQRI